MMVHLRKAAYPQPEFSTGGNFFVYFFLALLRAANVKLHLVLGGFLGAAPIYSNRVAEGHRHYPARLGGGGSL